MLVEGLSGQTSRPGAVWAKTKTKQWWCLEPLLLSAGSWRKEWSKRPVQLWGQCFPGVLSSRPEECKYWNYSSDSLQWYITSPSIKARRKENWQSLWESDLRCAAREHVCDCHGYLGKGSTQRAGITYSLSHLEGDFLSLFSLGEEE